ncbi:hypothetical protein LJD40_26510, partial [Escherichia coli]|nr:hypothetical protein [Escherichia coli]
VDSGTRQTSGKHVDQQRANDVKTNAGDGLTAPIEPPLRLEARTFGVERVFESAVVQIFDQ